MLLGGFGFLLRSSTSPSLVSSLKEKPPGGVLFFRCFGLVLPPRGGSNVVMVAEDMFFRFFFCTDELGGVFK
jgi:hypothetical protein